VLRKKYAANGTRNTHRPTGGERFVILNLSSGQLTTNATIQPSCPNVFIGHPQQARTMDSRLKRAGMTGNTSRLNSYLQI
jgi:hypothetical protein